MSREPEPDTDADADTGPMATFLVERYVPADRDLRDAVRRAVRVAEELDGADTPVRYLWSARIAADETWLCCFEAPDAGVVADLNRRAAFPFDRISRADVVWSASPTSPEDRP
jgi:Nickel responsive protein SCO4226-like